MNIRGKADGKAADENRPLARRVVICGKRVISPMLFLSKNRRFRTQ
jgi:hypothetical protein